MRCASTAIERRSFAPVVGGMRLARRPHMRCSLSDFVRRLAVATSVVGLIACQRGPAPARQYRILIEAEDAERTSLPGVEIARRGRSLGATSSSGGLKLDLSGSEGQLVELEARCPASFVPERQTLSVALRRLQDPRKMPTYRVTCRPELRTAVIAIRASNGPDLPVIYLGREIARTDSSGVAHVALSLRPGERYELGLDTGAKPLSPKNPRAVFVAGNEDELVFFDQRFQSKRPRAGGGRARLPTAF